MQLESRVKDVFKFIYLVYEVLFCVLLLILKLSALFVQFILFCREKMGVKDSKLYLEIKTQ